MFGMRLRERGFASDKIKRGPHKDRKGWFGIGLRADHPDPGGGDNGDDGSPGGPGGADEGPHSERSAEDGPLGESRADKPDSSQAVAPGGQSGPKNQYPTKQPPHVEKDVEKRSASSASSAKELSDLLAEPPDWLRVQAAKHLEKPTDRTLNPLCVAVSAHLYSDANRWQEVKPAVSDWLGKVSA
jgi:hypothetical protein